MSFSSGTSLLPAQIALAFAALAFAILSPPASGRMLLVPIGHHDIDEAARLARDAGAALVGPGPLPGSLVVLGDRGHVAAAMHGWQFALLAAPAAGCGDGQSARIRA